MRSSKTLHVISCHAEGEVGDVNVGGVTPPPGETLWEQSHFIAQDQKLRNFVLNEPPGGVFRHVNLLVPPQNPKADAGFIIIEPEDTPPMSSSNSICVATVLLDTGILPMQEPVTELTLEAPGGLIKIRADCRDGKAERITIQNLPSFACQLDARLEVAGLGTLTVDTAFGGDSFVIVEAETLGFNLTQNEAAGLAKCGIKITAAATEQLGFTHPNNPDWRYISFYAFAGPLEESKSGLASRSAVVIGPDKINRSPTGTAVSARMAVMAARGQIHVGQKFVATSIIGSQFTGQIVSQTQIGGKAAIIPQISGRGWITRVHQDMLDPADPWPEGDRLGDTWGH